MSSCLSLLLFAFVPLCSYIVTHFPVYLISRKMEKENFARLKSSQFGRKLCEKGLNFVTTAILNGDTHAQKDSLRCYRF